MLVIYSVITIYYLVEIILYFSSYIMNNFIISFFLLILPVSLFSQPKKTYNKFSIETTFCYSAPPANKSLNDNGHFASFPQIDFGLRYIFTKNWEAKAAINYAAFKVGLELFIVNNNEHPVFKDVIKFLIMRKSSLDS